MSKHRSPEPSVPSELVEDLIALYTPPGAVPPEVDERIASMAWQQCEQIKARRRIRAWGRVGVLLGVIFLVVWIQQMLHGPPGAGPAVEPVAGIADIDRNGRVDILDAFKLAREIEAGARLDAGWDVNRDGRIDQADVDAVGTSAVNLTRGI